MKLSRAMHLLYQLLRIGNDFQIFFTNFVKTVNVKILLIKIVKSQSVTLGAPLAIDRPAEEEEEEKTPTKCIKYPESVSIRCAVEYIDYEGRIDGESQESLKNIIIYHMQILRRRSCQPETHISLKWDFEYF